MFRSRAIAGLWGIRFGHVLTLFRLSIPARAGLVIYAGIGVHPDHAAAVRWRRLLHLPGGFESRVLGGRWLSGTRRGSSWVEWANNVGARAGSQQGRKTIELECTVRK